MPVPVEDYNLFLFCEHPDPAAFSALPTGFSFDFCRPDELAVWRAMPFDDAFSPACDLYMDDYYRRVYAPQGDAFFRRCVFVRNEAGDPVGTGMLWNAYDGTLPSLHWIKVLPAYEGRGIGRALLTRLLTDCGTDLLPVYLHTQPGSFRAIHLYTQFGFVFATDPLVGARENQLFQSLSYLREKMPAPFFAQLRFAKLPAGFPQQLAERDNEF